MNWKDVESLTEIYAICQQSRFRTGSVEKDQQDDSRFWACGDGDYHSKAAVALPSSGTDEVNIVDTPATWIFGGVALWLFRQNHLGDLRLQRWRAGQTGILFPCLRSVSFPALSYQQGRPGWR